MGQRGNYIFREGNKLTIHYTHWRANHIASDLYLGEKRFLDFVEECQLDNEILDSVWMEGCVIIDRQARQLYFWSLEINRDTAVMEYYLSELSKKWAGWDVQILRNRMYDAESVLGIDYVSQQELIEPHKVSRDFIINDKVEKWVTALVIIKEADGLFVMNTGDLTIEGIVSFGKDVVQLLKDKPALSSLPGEGDIGTDECIVIDTVGKRLIISESAFGLWEQCQDRWQDYSFTMGDYGYIEILQFAGIDASDLKMPMEDVLRQFRHMTNISDNFVPYEMAEKLLKEDSEIKFNPDFFDDVRPKPIDVNPKPTVIQKIGQGIRKLFGLK